MTTSRTIRCVRARRAGTTLLAVLLLMALSPGSQASTQSQLDAAKARLAALEKQIAAERAAVAGSYAAIARLAAGLEKSHAQYTQTLQELIQVRGELTAAQQEYDTVQGRLNQRAADVYMQGPGSEIEVLLGATSPADLFDRLQFLNQVSQADADLANQVQNLANSLQAKADVLQAVQARQAAVVKRLDSEQEAMLNEVARQQGQLSDMAHSRTEIEALVAKLHKQLTAEEMAAASNGLLGTNTAPFGKWAGLLLGRLGAPACQSNLVVLVAWQTAEYTAASWNPLATTLPMPGSTSFNSVGVQDYGSISQGLDATVLTLRNGATTHGYDAILSGVGSCADPMVTGEAINASDWCHGCAGGGYVIDIIPVVEAYYSKYANL